MDGPTRGVDVASRAEIYDLVRQAASRGTAILVISDDVEEIENMCTASLVLQSGELVARLDGEDLTQQKMSLAMYTGQHA
jgi:ABC-type sugar transport system ATPase subunit